MSWKNSLESSSYNLFTGTWFPIKSNWYCCNKQNSYSTSNTKLNSCDETELKTWFTHVLLTSLFHSHSSGNEFWIRMWKKQTTEKIYQSSYKKHLYIHKATEREDIFELILKLSTIGTVNGKSNINKRYYLAINETLLILIQVAIRLKCCVEKRKKRTREIIACIWVLRIRVCYLNQWASSMILNVMRDCKEQQILWFMVVYSVYMQFECYYTNRVFSVLLGFFFVFIFPVYFCCSKWYALSMSFFPSVWHYNINLTDFKWKKMIHTQISIQAIFRKSLWNGFRRHTHAKKMDSS